jgi:hypothetical protein
VQNEGSDTVIGFESNRDVLSFAGLMDQDAAGLLDDLDAVSSFSDLGAGNDVIAELDGGTHIAIQGIGTGNVNSWADIVSHPATQLVLA